LLQPTRPWQSHQHHRQRYVTTQPCCAAYGGDDIVQSHTVFLDSHWGVGASVRELVHGVDCPLTAAYMDVVTLYKGMAAPVVHKNAICVFESDQSERGHVVAPGLINLM
jgi:Cu2+-containing amine oxidase